MGRLSPQQGFLVSATVHLSILMIVINRPVAVPTIPIPVSSATPVVPTADRVYLPPADVVRSLRLPPEPVAPPPVPRALRDRISVGPPSPDRAKGPLVLRREDDLTAVPKGTPQGRSAPDQKGGLPTEETIVADRVGASGADSGLTLPRGPGRPELSGKGGPARPGASPGPAQSLADTLRDLDRRLADAGSRGLASGTGQQIGPFFFDPEGADFTAWLNHFKNDVYRNWTVPQPALLGMGGQVDLELTVERDGRVSSVVLLKSAGNVALDRAARNALLGSRAWELPADFGPPRLVMRVSFLYNVRPQGS